MWCNKICYSWCTKSFILNPFTINVSVCMFFLFLIRSATCCDHSQNEIHRHCIVWLTMSWNYHVSDNRVLLDLQHFLETITKIFFKKSCNYFITHLCRLMKTKKETQYVTDCIKINCFIVFLYIRMTDSLAFTLKSNTYHAAQMQVKCNKIVE